MTSGFSNGMSNPCTMTRRIWTDLSGFYRAMLCMRGMLWPYVCPPVCLLQVCQRSPRNSTGITPYRSMEATRSRHGWVHMFITHCTTVTLQLHSFDLFRTCRTSSFCTVAWQLARFQLIRRIAWSLGDSSAFVWNHDALIQYQRVYCYSATEQWLKHSFIYTMFQESDDILLARSSRLVCTGLNGAPGIYTSDSGAPTSCDRRRRSAASANRKYKIFNQV